MLLAVGREGSAFPRKPFESLPKLLSVLRWDRGQKRSMGFWRRARKRFSLTQAPRSKTLCRKPFQRNSKQLPEGLGKPPRIRRPSHDDREPPAESPAARARKTAPWAVAGRIGGLSRIAPDRVSPAASNRPAAGTAKPSLPRDCDKRRSRAWPEMPAGSGQSPRFASSLISRRSSWFSCPRGGQERQSSNVASQIGRA